MYACSTSICQSAHCAVCPALHATRNAQSKQQQQQEQQQQQQQPPGGTADSSRFTAAPPYLYPGPPGGFQGGSMYPYPQGLLQQQGVHVPSGMLPQLQGMQWAPSPSRYSSEVSNLHTRIGYT
jgi:transcription initiation factor TFIID subunit TAF12